MYHEENLTLAEIAAEFDQPAGGMMHSRTARKLWKNTKINSGLLEKFRKTSNAINEIDEKIDEIIEREDCGDSERLLQVKRIIDKLEE